MIRSISASTRTIIANGYLSLAIALWPLESTAATDISSPALVANCDPHKDEINSAIVLRDQGRFIRAQGILEPILKGDPNDFRTNFIMATVLLQSERNPSNDDAGMTALRKTENLLGAQPERCNERYGWYSIYNTLGSQYYRRHNNEMAERYLNLAYQHIDHLYSSTKQNLLVNLGILRFHQGRVDEALHYYDAAVAAGSKTAARYARAIRKIQRTKIPSSN